MPTNISLSRRVGRTTRRCPPTYITVSARDTQAPPRDNAEFAAKHIPHAELSIIPGDVDHEIFINECDHEGRDEFPEACIERRA